MLGFSQDLILVEQLRMTLHNVRISFRLDVAAIFILIWLFYTEKIAASLITWGVLTMSMRLASEWHAKKLLSERLNCDSPRRIARELIGINILMGTCWGLLFLAVTDSNSELMATCFLAIIASRMLMLAPFLPVLFASSFTQFLVMAAKYLQHAPSYYCMHILLLSLLFAGLCAQAHTISSNIRNLINSYSENIELLAQLREQKQRAKAAHTEALQASTAKSNFFAAASHDLRQPIHALGLFLEVLSRSNLNDHQCTVLGHARASSEASLQMLNALLDFSQIDLGAVQPIIQSLSLQHVLSKIEREFGPQANAKNLFYRTRDTKLRVQSDLALVEMILRNLVSNAIRYTHSGGILVACRARTNTVWLEVWDTGIGIEACKLHDIFREFHQIGNPNRDRNKGFGLGLAIVDGVVSKLGHQLTLHSCIGRGSVFKLGLPLCGAPSK